jgi:hypothetical protein
VDISELERLSPSSEEAEKIIDDFTSNPAFQLYTLLMSDALLQLDPKLQVFVLGTVLMNYSVDPEDEPTMARVNAAAQGIFDTMVEAGAPPREVLAVCCALIGRTVIKMEYLERIAGLMMQCSEGNDATG